MSTTDTIKKKTTSSYGLGRGLDSLIPNSQLNTQPQNSPKQRGIREVDIDLISRNKSQPRKHFDTEKLKKLAESIKSQGVLQPILVSKKDKGYEIVAGERRFRAANMAGLDKIPVILKDLDPSKVLGASIVENVQREDLNPIEEGQAYKTLVENHNLTHSEIAKLVGKDRASVSNLIRILMLSDRVKDLVARGLISLGHAKVLCSVSGVGLQNKYASLVVAKKLSVRGLERLINQKSKPVEDDKTLKLVDRIAKKLALKLKTKVAIDYKNEKGSISIHYYSSEQFNELVVGLERLDLTK